MAASFGSLGSARVEIRGDLKALDKDLRLAQQATKDAALTMARSMGQFEGSLKSTLTAAAALARGFAGLSPKLVLFSTIRDAIGVSREFNKSLSDLSAITGATGDDLKFLAGQAKQIGRPLGQAASETVTAFKLVGSAKPDLLANSEALAEVTKQSVILATASGLDLPSAAKAATSALNQFGEGADQAARFVNVLAAGARFGAAEVPAVTTALTKAGTVAADAGVSFELFNATVQELAAFGAPIEASATSFRNVLLKLRDGADDTNPAVVGLTEALTNLGEQNLSTAALAKRFGTENVVVAKQLLATTGSAAQLAETLTGTNTATEQAETNLDNLDGDLRKLSATFDALKLAIVGNEGALRDVVQTGTVSLEAIIENFEELSAIALDTGIVIGGVFAGRAASSLTDFVAQQNKAINLSLRRITVERDLAAKALELARANEVAARNNLILARDADKGTGSLRNQRAAAIELQKANKATRAAQERLTRAVKATSVAARAGSIAMRGLSTSMAFFGGPIGATITALSVAFAILGNRARGAGPKVEGLVERIRESTREAENAAKDQAQIFSEEIGALEKTLDELVAKRGELAAELAEPIDSGGFTFGDADAPEIGRAADEQAFVRLNEQIEKTRQTIAQSREELVKFEKALETLGRSTDTSGDDNATGTLTEEQRQAIDAVEDFIASVEDEIKVLNEDVGTREQLAAVLRAEAILKKEGLDLDKKVAGRIRSAVGERERLKQAEEDLTEARARAKDLIEQTLTAEEDRDREIREATELLPVLKEVLGDAAEAEEVLARAIKKANEEFETQQEEVEAIGSVVEDNLTSALNRNIETWDDLRDAAIDAIKNIILDLIKLEDSVNGTGSALSKILGFFGLGGEGGLFGSGATAASGTIATDAAGRVLGGIAHGGLIRGPGTGTSDSILARLSNGEFVVNARATNANLPLLEAINAGGLRAFAAGGLALPGVSAPILPQMIGTPGEGPAGGDPGSGSGAGFHVHFDRMTKEEIGRSLPQVRRAALGFLAKGGAR